MKKATIIILVVALTLTLAGGAILIGSNFYARSNGISPARAARGVSGVNVGEDGVHVGVGPVQVDVDGQSDSVNVRVGPFEVSVDGSGVTVGDRHYDSSSSWGSWNYGSETPKYYDKPVERSLEFDSLDSVSLSLVAREVEITQGEGRGSIVLYERFEGEFSSFEERNGRLIVSVNDKRTNIRGGFWSTSNRLTGDEARVRLVLPAGSSPDIKIEAVSGSVLLDGVSSGRVTVNNVSGGVTTRDCVFEAAELYSVSGSLKAEGSSLGGAKLQSVSGGIEAWETDFASLDAQTVSGWIELELTGAESGYRFDFDSVSGSLELNGTRYRGGSRVGSGRTGITVGTVSGGAFINTK